MPSSQELDTLRDSIMKKTIGARKCRQLRQRLSGLRPLLVCFEEFLRKTVKDYEGYPTEILPLSLTIYLDEDTTVSGVMIQVSEVKKWLEHAIEGKFPM